MALMSIVHAAWVVVLSCVWWPAAEAQVRNDVDVQSGADAAALPATLRSWHEGVALLRLHRSASMD